VATYGHRFAMANQPATGLARLLNAARFSLQGLRATYQNEEAFRQECLLLAVAIPLALWLGDTAFERVALISQPATTPLASQRSRRWKAPSRRPNTQTACGC